MGARNKPNHFIAAIEARKDAEWSGVVTRTEEIDLIAHIFSCADDFQVGPGRAEKCLCGFLESKQDIANMVIEAIDVDNDNEFLVPKRDIAWKLKHTLGPELWEKYKGFFPMVKDYW